eukprot:9618418-Alexandrium_andersonii.AAC.1
MYDLTPAPAMPYSRACMHPPAQASGPRRGVLGPEQRPGCRPADPASHPWPRRGLRRLAVPGPVR